MLAVVFAQLTSIVVESPRLRDFHGHQFDDDVHGLHALEIVCEVRAYPERRLAILPGVTLYLYRTVRVERIAEYDLLRAGVDA